MALNSCYLSHLSRLLKNIALIVPRKIDLIYFKLVQNIVFVVLCTSTVISCENLVLIQIMAFGCCSCKQLEMYLRNYKWSLQNMECFTKFTSLWKKTAIVVSAVSTDKEFVRQTRNKISHTEVAAEGYRFTSKFVLKLVVRFQIYSESEVRFQLLSRI